MTTQARPFRNVRLSLEELESRELPSSTLVSTTSNSDSPADDRLIVRWLSETPVASPYAAETEFIGNKTYSVTLKSGISTTDALAWYKAQSGIDFAQTDNSIQSLATANDTYSSQQWGLTNIGASTAWNYTTGSKQIIVAVIDTGVDYTHTDLAANIWKNTDEVYGNGVDDDGNGYADDYYGYNFSNSTTSPMDDNGHGTHVAGIIGAVGNNGTGVTGVNWSVQIMSLKFMNSSGSGYTSNAIKAIYYAVNNGAKVINNSWGGGSYDSALASAIAYARSQGVIVVNAAGNDGKNIDSSPMYPANINYDNVLTVAATDSSNKLASFSNYGSSTVDIAAPGVSILSTYLNNRYVSYSGTSMATPLVAGAIALLWSENPSWTYSQVINTLLTNTTASSSLSGKVAYGVLNIGKALQAVGTPDSVSAPSQAPTITANPASQSVYAGSTLTFTANATNATSVRWQVSTDGGNTWEWLSDGSRRSGTSSTTLTLVGITTVANGYRLRAVFSNESGLTTASSVAFLSVTSNSTYNAYWNAYYGYLYAYHAYQTGGGQYAYVAYQNAYYAYYYAYYAHYYASAGNASLASTYSYYSQYYSGVASNYSYWSYVTTGNVYSYYGWQHSHYAGVYSQNVMNGY